MIYEYFRVTGANDSVDKYADLHLSKFERKKSGSRDQFGLDFVFSHFGNANTKKDLLKDHQTMDISDESLHFCGEKCFSSRLTHYFLDPHLTSPLLRCAASHMGIGETRQRPKNNKEHHRIACARKKKTFSSHKMCLILISTIRCFFIFFGVCGAAVSKNQIRCFISSVQPPSSSCAN